MSKVSEFHSDSSKLECEVTSTRTFGNNKAERFKDKYDSVYLHRSGVSAKLDVNPEVWN